MFTSSHSDKTQDFNQTLRRPLNGFLDVLLRLDGLLLLDRRLAEVGLVVLALLVGPGGDLALEEVDHDPHAGGGGLPVGGDEEADDHGHGEEGVPRDHEPHDHADPDHVLAGDDALRVHRGWKRGPRPVSQFDPRIVFFSVGLTEFFAEGPEGVKRVN